MIIYETEYAIQIVRSGNAVDLSSSFYLSDKVLCNLGHCKRYHTIADVTKKLKELAADENDEDIVFRIVKIDPVYPCNVDIRMHTCYKEVTTTIIGNAGFLNKDEILLLDKDYQFSSDDKDKCFYVIRNKINNKLLQIADYDVIWWTDNLFNAMRLHLTDINMEFSSLRKFYNGFFVLSHVIFEDDGSFRLVDEYEYDKKSYKFSIPITTYVLRVAYIDKDLGQCYHYYNQKSNSWADYYSASKFHSVGEIKEIIANKSFHTWRHRKLIVTRINNFDDVWEDIEI